MAVESDFPTDRHSITSLSAVLTGPGHATTLSTMRVSLFAAAGLLALVVLAVFGGGFFDGHLAV
jgi:hypothetical protein